MKPLPQWLSWVVAISGTIAASTAVIEGVVRGFNEKNWLAVFLGLNALAGALAHSLTGTGGKAAPPTP